MTSAASGAAAPVGPLPPRASVIAEARAVGIRHEGAAEPIPAQASFTVARGEVVLLLGPSGAGKSTLALALNGLIPHAIPATLEGTVLIDGLDTRETPVAVLSTRVGMVFQDPDAQLVTGTLLDEVAFGPENLRMPVDEVLARTEDALRRVGLWERRSENPDRLSGGGRQRLAIACALAMGSPLLVLDEPTANLDPQGIEEFYTTLAELVTAGDRAIVLIEHNLDAVMAITDRVVVLDHAGRTVADGTVDEVVRARAEELHEMGVWLPISTLAALRLRDAGWPLSPLPVDAAELRAAVEAAQAPAEGAPAAGAPAGETSAAEMLPASASAAPLIRVTGLRTRRGRTEILHGVDLEIPAGQFVAIVGANGAGKTTLLQSIAGVVRIARGQVHIDGVDVARTDVRALSRRIGFVFQNPEHQFIAASAYEELAHGLRLQKLPDAEVRARALDVLRRFGLEDKSDILRVLLSGGQKRRLSVGTALVAGAPVLALDEPTFGQDRARADELMQLLRGLQDAGTTILMVTHDMHLVAEYAERTIVVGDGRIVADAPTPQIFADEGLLRSAGLNQSPLRRAFAGLKRHPALSAVTRLADLPAPAPELRRIAPNPQHPADSLRSTPRSAEFTDSPEGAPS